MGIRFQNRAWRWVGLVMGVGLPSALFWGMRLAGSWRPQTWLTDSPVVAMHFSPSAPLLAVIVNNDPYKEVRVWDLGRRQLVWSEKEWPDVETMDFSSDGRILITKTADRGIYLRDARTGRRLELPISLDLSHFDSLRLSADEKTLMLGDRDGSLVFYDMPTRRLIKHIKFPNRTYYEKSRFRVLPDERQDGQMRLSYGFAVTPDTKTCIATLLVGEFRNCYPVIPAEFADREVWVWDAKRGYQTLFPGAGDAAAFSPDSRLMASHAQGKELNSQLEVWNLEKRTLLRRVFVPPIEGVAGIGNVGFSADGTRLFAAVTSRGAKVKIGSQYTVVIWDVASGRVCRTFQVPPSDIDGVHLSLSADNSTMAVLLAPSEAVTLWRVE